MLSYPLTHSPTQDCWATNPVTLRSTLFVRNRLLCVMMGMIK